MFIETVTFQKGYTDEKKHDFERNNHFDNRSRISKLEQKTQG